jgi:hypothetical protein
VHLDICIITGCILYAFLNTWFILQTARGKEGAEIPKQKSQNIENKADI